MILLIAANQALFVFAIVLKHSNLFRSHLSTLAFIITKVVTLTEESVFATENNAIFI